MSCSNAMRQEVASAGQHTSHPDLPTLVSKDENIKALFLPPNTISFFQPMDHRVIEAMKRRYCKALLLLEDQEGRSIIQFVKQINMKDVYILFHAYKIMEQALAY